MVLEWLAQLPRDVVVLTTRADPFSVGAALALPRQLIRSAREQLDVAAALDETTRALVQELEGTAPGRARLPVLEALRKDPRLMAERLRKAFAEWLRAVAERHRVVLVLEDLHWADLPSVSFLLSALQEPAGRRLLAIGLARPEVLERFPELRERTFIAHCALPALDSDASRGLVAARAQAADARTIERLLSLGAGNPFYLEELARQEAMHPGSPLPESIVAMASSRLLRLSPRERRLLRAG
jgi:predicted ATPase